MVPGDRSGASTGSRAALGPQRWGDPHLAVLAWWHGGRVLLPSPHPDPRMAPRVGSALRARVLAGAAQPPGRLQPSGHVSGRGRCPSAAVDGISGLSLTVRPLPEILGPALAPLGLLIPRGPLFKGLTVRRQPCRRDTAHPRRWQPGPRQTAPQVEPRLV